MVPGPGVNVPIIGIALPPTEPISSSFALHNTYCYICMQMYEEPKIIKARPVPQAPKSSENPLAVSEVLGAFSMHVLVCILEIVCKHPTTHYRLN